MPLQNAINQSQTGGTISGSSISSSTISSSTISSSTANLTSLTINSFNPMPIVGESRVFPSPALPTGWLIEDGAAISRTTYSQLFAVISTLFGLGDGSTTFNLPDSRGRSLLMAGQGSGLTQRAIGTRSGTETHTLSTAEMPWHNHSASDAGHTHSTYLQQTGQQVAGYGLTVTGGFVNRVYVDGYSGTLAQALTSFASISVGFTGSSAAHNNMHPFIVRGVQAIFTGVA